MKAKIPTEDIGIAVVDFGFAGLLSVCRSIFPGEIIPSRVCLERPKPTNTDDFDEFYGVKVEFGCKHHEIVLPMEVATRSLDLSDPVLAAYQDSLADDYINRVVNHDFDLQVREKIIVALQQGEPSQLMIAADLNVSPRQLQRLLQKENTNFKGLLKTVRMELAERYLQQGYRPITEVALLLGFTDHSNFTRAFKRWFDCTPTQYRDRQ